MDYSTGLALGFIISIVIFLFIGIGMVLVGMTRKHDQVDSTIQKMQKKFNVTDEWLINVERDFNSEVTEIRRNLEDIKQELINESQTQMSDSYHHWELEIKNIKSQIDSRFDRLMHNKSKQNTIHFNLGSYCLTIEDKYAIGGHTFPRDTILEHLGESDNNLYSLYLRRNSEESNQTPFNSDNEHLTIK